MTAPDERIRELETRNAQMIAILESAIAQYGTDFQDAIDLFASWGLEPWASEAK